MTLFTQSFTKLTHVWYATLVTVTLFIMQSAQLVFAQSDNPIKDIQNKAKTVNLEAVKARTESSTSTAAIIIVSVTALVGLVLIIVGLFILYKANNDDQSRTKASSGVWAIAIGVSLMAITAFAAFFTGLGTSLLGV